MAATGVRAELRRRRERAREQEQAGRERAEAEVRRRREEEERASEELARRLQRQFEEEAAAEAAEAEAEEAEAQRRLRERTRGERARRAEPLPEPAPAPPPARPKRRREEEGGAVPRGPERAEEGEEEGRARRRAEVQAAAKRRREQREATGVAAEAGVGVGVAPEGRRATKARCATYDEADDEQWRALQACDCELRFAPDAPGGWTLAEETPEGAAGPGVRVVATGPQGERAVACASPQQARSLVARAAVLGLSPAGIGRMLVAWRDALVAEQAGEPERPGASVGRDGGGSDPYFGDTAEQYLFEHADLVHGLEVRIERLRESWHLWDLNARDFVDRLPSGRARERARRELDLAPGGVSDLALADLDRLARATRASRARIFDTIRRERQAVLVAVESFLTDAAVLQQRVQR